MTQYNPNTSGTSTSGFTATGCTITGTADGLRIVKSAGVSGYVDKTLNTVPSGTTLVGHGWRVRRNTAASGTPLSATLGIAPQQISTIAPVGSFVAYPRLVGSNFGSPTSFRITLPTAQAIDITVTGLAVYDQPSAPANSWALDASDADFAVTGGDSTLVRTFQHANSNNESVGKVTWIWGDGSSQTEQAMPGQYVTPAPSYPAQFAATPHTFPEAGIYTVTCRVDWSRWQEEPSAAAATYSRTAQVMVPTGPFVADYTYSASNLVASVNAGISQVPTYDTISSYTWEWGDGTPNGSGATASHTYAEPGTYAVKLTTRTPATLRESSKTQNIVVELPPTPPADLTAAIAKSIYTGRFSSWNVGSRVEELPTPSAFSFAVPADDMPSLTMTYSLKGENGDKVRDLVGQEYDLAFEAFNPKTYQWFEPRGCRFVVQDDDLNLMDATGMVKLKAVGVVNDLDGMIVTARESPQIGRSFSTTSAITAGRVMGTLLEAEISNYAHVITRSFSNTVDSSSTAWSKSLNSVLEVGASETLLQVLQNLSDMGLCHWTSQGNELLLFDDGSPNYGLDLSYGGANDVFLLPGREVKAIQTNRTRRDYVSRLFIPNSEDETFFVRDSGAVSRRGRKAQILSGGVATAGDANLVASAILGDSGKIKRDQYTYELNLSNRLGEGGALPFIDYNPGDSVWAVGATGQLEPMVVQQITLTGGAGKPIEGSVILADRLLMQAVRRAKETARAFGGGTRFGGAYGSAGGSMRAQSAAQTAALTLTTSWADLPGCTVTIPVYSSADAYLVTAAVDAQDLSGSQAGLAVARLSVNGVAIDSQVVFSGSRGTVGQNWLIQGLPAGNRVFKLQGILSGSGANYRTNATHTTITVAQIR